MPAKKPEVQPTVEAKAFRVQSVARASAIVFAVARQEYGLSRKEISETTNLPTQTTYHLLHTLSQLGLLARNDQGKYILGLRVGSLSEGFRRQLGSSRQLSHMLRRIARITGETTYAARWIDGEVVSIEIVRGHHPIQALELPHGFSADAHARSGGKVLLAHATDSQREEYFRTHKLKKRTPNTITSLTKLNEQFASIREEGYAIEREEFAIGLCCVGVPLDAGLSPFAIGVSAPTDRFNKNLESYIRTLTETANAIDSED
jgi:IclR family transcriptional regulator, acetate operon repressor